MFFKKIKLKRTAIFAAAASAIMLPSVALAQWDVGAPPGGLFRGELATVLSNILIYIIGFIGILGIIFLVYGGIRYVTSAGNDSEMEEAKKIIMYAIIGLFVTASAYAIVKTVVNLSSSS